MFEKVLLFIPSKNAETPPKMLQEICPTFTTLNSRTGAAIDFLLNLPVVDSKNRHSILSTMKVSKNHGQIIHIKNVCDKDIFWFLDESGHEGTIELEEVDSSRPWRISDYDGNEYIDYLDTPGIYGGTAVK